LKCAYYSVVKKYTERRMTNSTAWYMVMIPGVRLRCITEDDWPSWNRRLRCQLSLQTNRTLNSTAEKLTKIGQENSHSIEKYTMFAFWIILRNNFK